MKRAAVAVRRTILAIGFMAALTAAPAHAGTYAVVGGCGNWTPSALFPAYMAVYGDCSVLVVRHVKGAFTSPWGVYGYWRFDPPPGTVIGSVSITGNLVGRNGWTSTIEASEGLVLDRCPGATTCPGGSKSVSFTTAPLGRTVLFLSVACWQAAGCTNNNGVHGLVEATGLVVYIQDSTSPSVAITGGDLLAGWRRLRGTVGLSASDNVGIKVDRLLVDGITREQRARACVWGARVPCWNGPAELSLDTTLLSDGPHTLTVQSIDSADNVGSASQVIQVDNTAPAGPSQATLAGSSEWRASNRFALSWVNPPQPHAPIVATRYELCPVAIVSGGTGCVTGLRAGAGIHDVSDLVVPAPGAWRLRWWLVDAAGNENPRSAAETVLRFDNVPPTVAFRDQNAADPARLRVSAQDATSETTNVEIEARRTGSVSITGSASAAESWISLPTERSGRDFTAFMDDETLPRGTYELRARAVDAAGNERTTMNRDSGNAALITLPVRDATQLRVGRAHRRCATNHGRRRCTTRLDNTLDVDLGQRLTLTGRLRINGRPAAGPIAAFQQLKLRGAQWKQIAMLDAAATGIFRYAVEPGPARRLRFRFAGTELARGATAVVDARVRAATTLDVSRRDAVNGEYVTFRGRVRGGHLPAGGKLVELQVFTRRRWRTFALPRADAQTGRWSYQYRFETIRGTARFRFRARVQREAGYPFHTGTSRQVRVVVHGI